METMGAAKFKTQCLGVADEVQLRNMAAPVTQKAKPAAVIQTAQTDEDPLAVYRFGGVKIVGDITSPVSDPRDWEYD
ncbi:MAG TPA: hypothetical protein VIJ79_05355 [Acidobacteriaceae bacterium]